MTFLDNVVFGQSGRLGTREKNRRLSTREKNRRLGTSENNIGSLHTARYLGKQSGNFQRALITCLVYQIQ